MVMIFQLVDCLNWRVQNDIDDILAVSDHVLSFRVILLIMKKLCEQFDAQECRESIFHFRICSC